MHKQLFLAIQGKNGIVANYQQTLEIDIRIGVSAVHYVLIGQKKKDFKNGISMMQQLNKVCEVLRMEVDSQISVIYQKSDFVSQIMDINDQGMLVGNQPFETFKTKKLAKEKNK